VQYDEQAKTCLLCTLFQAHGPALKDVSVIIRFDVIALVDNQETWVAVVEAAVG
jgi:Holliday junction resolvase-like predicted endonuclease